MRKVKVLAFVLAALMVVAAFAGCGTKDIKADVTTLDERVTALEALLKQVNDTVNGGATKDDITEILDAITANKAEAAAGDKTLADAIAKITADQATANAALKADLEKLVDAAKKDQAAGDAALQVAIEKLNNSIDATNKALADAIKDLEGDITAGDKATLDAVKELLDAQNKDIADALAKIEETIAKNQEAAGANADLQAAINKYVGELTVLKTTYDLERANYTAEENAKIAAVFSTGIAAVQAATTVDIAKGQYDATIAALAKYNAKDEALYNAVMALKGNVSKGTKNAVTELDTLYAAVVEHYGTDTKAYTEYVNEAGKKVNLSTEVANIKAAQNKVNSMLADGGEIKTLVAGINGVTYVAIDAYKSGDSTKVANITEINTLKAKYETVKNIVAGTQSTAAYIADSVLDEVTNYNKLVEYIAKANGLAAAKAAFTSYGELTSAGTYSPVFAEYIALLAGSDAAKYNWWNQEALYAKVSARVDAWRAAFPVVDDNNAHGIINAAFAPADNTYTFYKNYLAAEAEVALFVAKYNDYVSNIKPQVTTLEGMTKVTTENVKAYADLKKAIEAWNVVKPDGSDAGTEPDLVVGADQFNAMLAKIYGTNLNGRSATNPFYFTKEEVRTFFNTTVKDAEAVATKINNAIKALDDADGTALSVLPYKVLEGYKLGTTNSANNYKMDSATYNEAQVVAEANPTIYMFKKAFVKTDYDLTYLLNLDKFAASEAVVAERVASYKAITDKIHSNLDAIEKALTFKVSGVDTIQLEKVSLDNEAAVKTLKDDYTALIAKGYKYDTTMSWNAAKKSNGTVISDEFTCDRLMENKDYYDVTGLILRVEELRAMATNLITFFGKVAAVNSYAALTVKDADTTDAVYKKVSTTANNVTTHKYDFIGDSYELGLRKFVPTYKANQTAVANVMSQAAAVELAWTAYAKFVADNQNKKDAAVEVALADNGLVELKLLVIKAKAYNEVEAITSSAATAWQTSYGDFATQQKIQLAAIVSAPSVEVISDILYGFYQMTGKTYNEVKFDNALILHTNGHRHLTGTNVVCPDCP